MSQISNNLGFSPSQLDAIRREVENRVRSFDFGSDEKNIIPASEYNEFQHVPRNEGVSTHNAANQLSPQQIEQNTNCRIASLDMGFDLMIQNFRQLEERVLYVESLLAGKR